MRGVISNCIYMIIAMQSHLFQNGTCRSSGGHSPPTNNDGIMKVPKILVPERIWFADWSDWTDRTKAVSKMDCFLQLENSNVILDDKVLVHNCLLDLNVNRKCLVRGIFHIVFAQPDVCCRFAICERIGNTMRGSENVSLV